MSVSVKFSKSPAATEDTVVLLCDSESNLLQSAPALDEETGGLITRAVQASPKFSGKVGETMTVALPDRVPYARAVIAGVGDVNALDALKMEEAGGALCAALNKAGAVQAAVLAGAQDYAVHMIAGLKLRSYHFNKYKTKEPPAPPLSAVTCVVSDVDQAVRAFQDLDHVISGVFTARDLVNEAPNVLYPEAYAQFIKKTLTPLGVKVQILDEKKMTALGMGAALAVGMGSARKPRMVIMQWCGGKKTTKRAPLALVGKGVTFDTGGISLKPGAGMDEMKMDMGGSAAVVGTMQALALRGSGAHVVGIVGLAENMPSADAYRPGDIIKSLSGKTIEVLNTDAEGRLVLADALTYVQAQHKPEAIIDLATLTGAMMVALGHEYCGTFATDDALWEGLAQAGAATGEKLWRLPLDKAWKKQMESDVADLRNLSKSRFAGACTAAGFLQHFIEGDTPWAHMDIAGTAWRKADKPVVPKFGTGFGVRALNHLIAARYE